MSKNITFFYLNFNCLCNIKNLNGTNPMVYFDLLHLNHINSMICLYCFFYENSMQLKYNFLRIIYIIMILVFLSIIFFLLVLDHPNIVERYLQQMKEKLNFLYVVLIQY